MPIIIEPKTYLGRKIAEIRTHVSRGRSSRDAFDELLDGLRSSVVIEGSLSSKIIRADGSVEDYGIEPCNKVVTTAGVNAIVQAILNAFTLPNFKYHAVGTSNTGPAIGDTALAAELTTQYNPINTRATGSQGVGSSNNNYQTTATNTIQSGPVTIQEWGLLSQAATGGGTLLDRKLIGPFTLQTGDSYQSQYNLTFGAGG